MHFSNIKNKSASNTVLFALAIFSFINYIIRSYLEMDAMINAKPLAEQYLKREGTLTEKRTRNNIKQL